MEKTTQTFQGNAFYNTVHINDTFTVEDFSEEHELMASTVDSFVEQEVMPVLPEMEKQQFQPSVDLLKKAGELGLLGVDIPEDCGGLALDKISSVIIMEKMAKARSFSVTYGGQVGIGSLPIVLYGTKEQQQKYLPDVMTGEKIGAYALTEPAAGTDAVSIKTTAYLSEDCQYYVINGEKQFITNSRFADFFVLYAKVDGEKFTVFIVERDTEGLTIGAEEQKMGLKGSSTASLILEDVKVPVENVLGDIGKGHRIAFNILNIGRHKISASCVGSAKRALELAVNYVTERKQFQRSLADFPLIKEKIAVMASKLFAAESMVYRTAGELEKGAQFGKEHGIKFHQLLKNYAQECSVNKIFASEMLDYVVDEALQMHGGYGYISEYEIETLYRDARINRIFEGTNEINRVVAASTALQAEEGFPAEREIEGRQSDRLDYEWSLLHLLREITSLIVTYGKEKGVHEDQQMQALLADLIKAVYAVESSLVRVEKQILHNHKNTEQSERLVRIFTLEAVSESAVRVLLEMKQSGENVLLKTTELLDKVKQSDIDVQKEKRDIADNISRNS
ncbi:butyryl-CoA dehydrogenase [Alteribacillus persepolensis]|uniref:Butyryl-CoA dehydrogenase n=1 Tax=Alteribacillus persepolensis TaxID=568899 RepID=A0A1G8A9Z9_9BACI|nr:acyl-CoA dehydrogenase family protein [Alteribacillus persepolensis]SDH17180.1 butyryl-CoA dehydrogenase [Alteribacillus persepolensis]